MFQQDRPPSWSRCRAALGAGDSHGPYDVDHMAQPPFSLSALFAVPYCPHSPDAGIILLSVASPASPSFLVASSHSASGLRLSVPSRSLGQQPSLWPPAPSSHTTLYSVAMAAFMVCGLLRVVSSVRTASVLLPLVSPLSPHLTVEPRATDGT